MLNKCFMNLRRVCGYNKVQWEFLNYVYSFYLSCSIRKLRQTSCRHLVYDISPCFLPPTSTYFIFLQFLLFPREFDGNTRPRSCSQPKTMRSFIFFYCIFVFLFHCFFFKHQGIASNIRWWKVVESWVENRVAEGWEENCPTLSLSLVLLRFNWFSPHFASFFSSSFFIFYLWFYYFSRENEKEK